MKLCTPLIKKTITHITECYAEMFKFRFATQGEFYDVLYTSSSKWLRHTQLWQSSEVLFSIFLLCIVNHIVMAFYKLHWVLCRVDNREDTARGNIAWQRQMDIITNIYFPKILHLSDLKSHQQDTLLCIYHWIRPYVSIESVMTLAPDVQNMFSSLLQLCGR